MSSAFIRSTPLFSTRTPQPAISPTTPTMRCRRDLKKEKSIRNLAFARAHRKRTTRRFFNRHAAAAANQTEDNRFLSSVYGTLRFGAAAKEKDENNNSK